MRRSDHPSRPSAITCCRFSALKTLPIPAAGVQPTAQVNVSAPGAALAGFQVSINGRFWVSTEGHTSDRMTKRYAHAVPDLLHAAVQRLADATAPRTASAGDPVGAPSVRARKVA